jgi:hypothetical protein
MCSEQRHGTPQETLENLRQPMPITRKLRLVLRNNLIKLRTRQSCCGNHGQPGC